MKRWLFFAYGTFCYLLFLATFAYMAVFVGNLWGPKTIDSPPADSVLLAIIVNVLLLALFAIQHSVMARPGFKRAWTRLVPNAIERSTYVLASCLVTIFVLWQWRPIDTVVWDVELPILRGALWALFAAGWLAVPAVSLLINHFDLFGLRQVWLYLRGRPYTPLPLRMPAVYARIRHPLYVAWAVAFWATPSMTVGHLLFAGVLTGYMVAAVFIEERDLVAHFGAPYEAYQKSVPKFIPQLRTSRLTYETSQHVRCEGLQTEELTHV